VFIWKYGDTEKFYYAYGFDRKNMSRKKVMNEYIINEQAFLQRIKYRNYHIHKGMWSARAIVSDKFYFFLFLKSLGIPTPMILYYTRNGKLFYGVGDKTISEENSIETVFEQELDGFAKPFGGQMGTGAFSLSIQNKTVFVNNQPTTKENVLKTITNTNYIIQERVVQHPLMNKLCSTSLNTIRMITLITEDEEIIVVRAGARIGREGNVVDNTSKGGMMVGIDLNTGRLMKKGFIKPGYGTVVTQHPDNGLVFEGFEIPYFKEAVELAKELHSKLYRIHSVGWDIAITPNGPMFIEGNSIWEIGLIQATMGGLKSIEKYFD